MSKNTEAQLEAMIRVAEVENQHYLAGQLRQVLASAQQINIAYADLVSQLQSEGRHP
jgi:hypothetical protein